MRKHYLSFCSYRLGKYERFKSLVSHFRQPQCLRSHHHIMNGSYLSANFVNCHSYYCLLDFNFSWKQIKLHGLVVYFSDFSGFL